MAEQVRGGSGSCVRMAQVGWDSWLQVLETKLAKAKEAVYYKDTLFIIREASRM